MTNKNPFFLDYNSPHDTIPFEKIKLEHYKPAFEKGMEEQKKEIDSIVNNADLPSFENTVEALENSGHLLSRVSSPFYNLLSAETSDELQALAQELSPLLSEHANSIGLNSSLFERIKLVYEQKETFDLNTEESMLLEKTFDGFVRKGAALPEKEKERYRELSKNLSQLTLQFAENALKATNEYSLLIKDKNRLVGLPEDLLETLAESAKKKNETGWLLDLKATCYLPVMKYAENRELRKELYMAAATKCTTGAFDNREIIKQIVNNRLEIAQILGYKNYAEYVLEKRMAERAEKVYALLDQLLDAYRPLAEKELTDLQHFADENGADFSLEMWDWAFYAEKLKAKLFDLNDSILKPYFELEKVKSAVFGLATRLYGISFEKNNAISCYQNEVEAFDIVDKNGKYLAVLYTDFHPREGKQAGAWMSEYKGQWFENGEDSRPHITIVMNFTRKTASKPALLNYDELTTFLHEFGHALHGILTRCNYQSLSGTNVYRDFVELPSQLLENWASQKEFLDSFAEHYLSGEKIPTTLIQRIRDAENFNAGYLCLRQLSFGYLDMAWHSIESPFDGDIREFEQKAIAKTQIISLPALATSSTAFSHIFAGGYAAGYYGYKWAEVLEADAFSLFEERGIFDKETAHSFYENILMRGGTEHPMELYKRFRGEEPSIDALLKKSGIEPNS